MTEMWRITIDVPADVTDRDGLFAAVADAVHEWEPAARSNWDADVTAGPVALIRPRRAVAS